MPTPREPHKLKNGVDAHVLTDDERRKGALVAAERRRHMGLSLRQRIAEKLDENADELVGAALKAAKDGDWRAFQATVEMAHGKPPVEVTGEDGSPIQVEVSDARERLAAEAARIAERDTTP